MNEALIMLCVLRRAFHVESTCSAGDSRNMQYEIRNR